MNPIDPTTSWQQKLRGVSSRDCYMLENNMFTDCSFLEIFCHRLYLAKTSPVFAAMLHGEFSKIKGSSLFNIRINDTSPAAFSAMLDYVYSGKVSTTDFDLLWALLALAKKYMMDELLDVSRQYIWNYMPEPHKLWNSLKRSDELDETELKNAALRMIQNPSDDRIPTIIVNKNFLRIPQPLLLDIVQSKSIKWPEVVIYLACCFWCQYQASQKCMDTLINLHEAIQPYVPPSVQLNKYLKLNTITPTVLPSSTVQIVQAQTFTDEVKTLMAPFLPHIRFLTMTPEELDRILTKYSIFTAKECCFLYTSLTSSKYQYLPDEFCKLRWKRLIYEERSLFYTFGCLENKKLVEHYASLLCPMEGKSRRIYRTKSPLKCVIVKFPTQIKPEGVECDFYEERFSLILKGAVKHHKGPLTIHVRYDSFAEVEIDLPIDIGFRDKDIIIYHLEVKFVQHKAGTYPMNKPVSVFNTIQELEDYNLRVQSAQPSVYYNFNQESPRLINRRQNSRS
ncbi:hypothetical protein B566_EDAN008853 [Ephemera danica]|nr:hypothetical protein B566_EDAN008853 [Ephemera danica]